MILAALAAASCGGEGTPVNTRTTLELGWMDQAADPCADFERFACGGFKPVFAGDGGRGSVFGDLQVERLRTEYTALWRTSHVGELSRPDALTSDFAKRCTAAFDDGEPSELKRLLDGVVPATPADLARIVAQVKRDGATLLFRATLSTGADGRQMLTLVPGGFGLSRARTLDAGGEAIRAGYRSHMDKLSTQLRDPVDAPAVWAIESALAAASLTDEERTDPASRYQTITRDELRALTPSFDWASYFAAIGHPDLTDLVLASPSYFRALDAVLVQASPDHLADYGKWRLMEAYADSQGRRAREHEFAYHSKLLSGVQGEPSTNDQSSCFNDTQAWLPDAMAQLWLRGSETANEDAMVARHIVSEVRRGLESRIWETPWLDSLTRIGALDKLAQLHEQVGFPADPENVYPGLVLPDGGYVAALQGVSRYFAGGQLAAVGKLINRRNLWPLSADQVNAAYVPAFNMIHVPSGILGKPFFHRDANAASHFGAIGSIVGHELTHALDQSGRTYGPTGARANWWTPGADAAFVTQTECLVEQFDAIEPLPGVPIDGLATLGENMADLGGVLVAYRALEASGQPVHDWESFSRDQQFFLSYAQSHCEVIDKAGLARQLSQDPHSPARHRINATLANVPEFARAFSCSAGRPMARAAACQIW